MADQFYPMGGIPQPQNSQSVAARIAQLRYRKAFLEKQNQDLINGMNVGQNNIPTSAISAYQDFLRKNPGQEAAALEYVGKFREAGILPSANQLTFDQRQKLMEQQQENMMLRSSPERAGAKERAQLEEQLGLKPKIEAATELEKKRSETTANKEANVVKAYTSLQGFGDSNENVSEAIDDAIKNTGVFTSGFFGRVGSYLPGTPQYDLARTIDTIKSNIGFDKLQAMREASPTGGALGQVSDFENRQLQATIANLEQSQSPEQLKRNLEKVKKQREKSWDRVKKAYILEYGSTAGFIAPEDIEQKSETEKPATTSYSTMSDEELLKALK